MSIHIFFLLMWFFLPNFVNSDENIHIVNSRKPLHVVSDKFLSLSVDPAILLARINLSDISIQMARHLSPAYVRIAGPSTEFVKYIDTDDKSTEMGSNDLNSVIVTPSVWFAINEWFGMANLTPVFGINDAETAMGVWNPKSILPLLEISDKFNLTCLWQLGYDCSNKTDTQYIEDLKILRHILDAFPDKKDSWKIVGSNIRECSTHYGARRTIDDLKGIADFVMWEHSENEIDNRRSRDDFVRPFISSERNKPKVWTSVSKSHHPITFDTALQWAREVGEASKHGFDVILRQPRVHEFFIDTPVFWFSLMYKSLVGNIILDMKSTGPESKAEAFAYCAKNQNNFIHRGAIAVMIVNQEDTEHKAQIGVGVLAKTMEVQSYILSSKADMRSVYLNGERLKAGMLEQDKIVFTPKHRRAKPFNGISLSVPPKSIGFFVLPGAKVSTCIEEEDEMTLLMEEIKEDQELPFSEEIAVDMVSRLSQGNSLSLSEMQKNLEEELKEDEKFYHTDQKGKTNQKLDDILENLKEEYQLQESQSKLGFRIDDDTRKMILERAKLAEAQRKITESEQRLLDLGKLFLKKSNNLPKHIQEVDNTENDSVEIISNISGKTSGHKTELKVNDKPKTNSLRDFIANRPKLNKLTSPKLNTIHEHINNHLETDHNKLILAKPKSLHEQFKKVLEKPNPNILRKHEANEWSSDKSTDVELELSSAEIKKVLADRVKARAAKTNIRFTNEELVELMKKATARLKHGHILKQRGKRDMEFLRLKRDINMKLLNEATKHQELKKEKKVPDTISEESYEITPKKPNVSKLFPHTKHIIVSPFAKNSKSRKAIKVQDDTIEDLSVSQPEDELDFYFDEGDSVESKDFSSAHGSLTKSRKNGKSRKFNFEDIAQMKLALKNQLDPKMKTRAHEFDDENDFERKYMRLDEYFKNAKEVQEKFDDIDFSDESDYDHMESNEKPIRLKRDIGGAKSDCNCGCKHESKEIHENKCPCNSNLGKDITQILQTLINNANKENSMNFMKDHLDEYKKLAKSINDKRNEDNVKVKRSYDRNEIYPQYTPLINKIKKWHPWDIVLPQKNIAGRQKYHVSRMINDLPLYQHLLHGNVIKRSIKDNRIAEDSDESLESMKNEIEKNISMRSEYDKVNKDFQLVFPNKDKFEIMKNDDLTKLSFEHKKKISSTPVPKIDPTTNMDRGSYPNKIEVGAQNHKKNIIPLKKFHDVSNIQKISKEQTAFHQVFHELTSWLCEVGSKIKNYFDSLIK